MKTTTALLLLPVVSLILLARSYAADTSDITNVYLPLVITTEDTVAQSYAERALLDAINNERVKYAMSTNSSCPALKVSKILTTAAREHSQDMALNDYFDHIAPDGSSPLDRTTKAGYLSSYVGENIAIGYSTAAAVAQSWMASAGHRQNILNCNYTETGIGYYFQSDDQNNVRLDGQGTTDGPFFYYWTQIFGKP